MINCVNKITKYLKQPYPIQANPWKTILVISLFVSFFMLFFQPFGLSEYHSNNKVLILLGYGFVTFLVQVLVLIILPKFFKSFFHENNWTFLRHLILLLGILFFIGVGNFVYSMVVFSFGQNILIVFSVFQVVTLVIGLFPVSAVLVLSQNRKLIVGIKQAKELTKVIENRSITDTNENEIVEFKVSALGKSIQINPSHICYIASQGNYVDFYIINKGEVLKNTIRSTIKVIEETLKDYNFLLRCHRAYIVNTNLIEDVNGNAQGLRLSIKGCSEKILVSRSYVSVFKSKIKLHNLKK